MTVTNNFPWPSPLSAENVVRAQAARRELQLYAGEHFLLERRPQQQGRSVLLKLQQYQAVELLPSEYSVRSRVHEYGGGSYLVCVLGLYFVEEKSQQIYFLAADAEPVQVTQQQNARFADMCLHLPSRRLICVREQHEEHAVINDLVSVSVDSGEIEVLASGEDFYSSPCLSSKQSELAFISWSHPNMPWHNNSLWRAAISLEAKLSELESVAGASSSKGQPQWGPSGELYYLDDISGWWNIWRQQTSRVAAEHLVPVEAELGRAQWELAASSYVLLHDASIAAIGSIKGQDKLLRCDLVSKQWMTLDASHAQCAWLKSDGSRISYVAASADSAHAVYSVEDGNKTSLIESSELPLGNDFISVAESIEFDTRTGSVAQGFFYKPCNPNIAKYNNADLPPLLVVMHGGPTSACSNAYNSLVQYWTSRGLAVFDLNYRGSTGFGRDYRMALGGAWGVADVEDCEDAVKALVQAGLVDKRRVAIRGGSAGGFTALAAAVHSDVFAVVGCHYGVADLEMLARDTHKFESRYLDHLIGPYPERRDRYKERSPIHHLEKISCPVFISHGLLDHVVPVNQAYEMSEALLKKGLEVELLLFDDERHGYTQEENIATLLQQELAFYAKTFNR